MQAYPQEQHKNGVWDETNKENPPTTVTSDGHSPTPNVPKTTLGFTAANLKILVDNGFDPHNEGGDWEKMRDFLEEFHSNNETAMDVSYDYTDSAVTRSDVTSGQAGAKEESARVAASGSDMQNGVSTSKGTKRKRKTRRGRKNQVASEAAEVGKGEGAPQANWGVHALNERFVGLHFWDRRWFYYMGFSLEECNTLLYFGYTPWQNDCQQMSEFLERYNSGRPEYYYL